MRNKAIWRLAFLLFAALPLFSCQKVNKNPNGDRGPMEWKAEVPVSQTSDGVYEVAADGTTFTFTCRNYSRIRFQKAEENEKGIFPRSLNGIEYSLISNESFRAEIRGNELTIEFKANNDSQTRNTSVTVRDGDISYTFHFQQNSVWQGFTCQAKYAIFGISDELKRFYDVTVDYLDLDGKQHSEVITDNSWYYVPETFSVADAPEKFNCKIALVRKGDLPQLKELEDEECDYFEIGYGVDVHIEVLDASGEKVFSVKQPQMASFVYRTTPKGLLDFLNASEAIETATLSISKEDLIAGLK